MRATPLYCRAIYFVVRVVLQESSETRCFRSLLFFFLMRQGLGGALGVLRCREWWFESSAYIYFRIFHTRE